MEFIRKRVQMAKVKVIRNFFNSPKEADTPALVASATDEVSQSELLIVENEIKKSTQVRKCASVMSQKISKLRLKHML